MNTKLSYISFKESQVRHDNILKTFVYGIRYGEDKWIKIYKTDIDFTPLRIENAQSASPSSLITAHSVGVLNEQRCKTIIESEFVFEVYYQKKAHELNESCGFISPAVIDYGAFIDEYYVYHYMIMDYIPETKLQKDECDAIKEKVALVDACLRKNGIFHNDLAARNVFSRDSNPIIIDFGQALNKERGEHFSLECDKINASPSMPQNLPLRAITPSPSSSPSGGKRKKPHFSKKKRMSKKKKHVS